MFVFDRELGDSRALRAKAATSMFSSSIVNHDASGGGARCKQAPRASKFGFEEM